MSTKDTYEIPVDFLIKHTISVSKDEACDLDEAIYVAKQIFAKRIESGTFLDFVERENVDAKSAVVPYDLAKELNPPKTYTVLVTRTQSVEVTVEAYSADDAETEAYELVENGDIPSVDWETDGEISIDSVEEE